MAHYNWGHVYLAQGLVDSAIARFQTASRLAPEFPESHHNLAAAFLRRNEFARARPPRIDAVDTTGAGDAFTATLAVALASGMEPEAALETACCAGALTATRRGAQSSPTLSEIKQVQAY